VEAPPLVAGQKFATWRLSAGGQQKDLIKKLRSLGLRQLREPLKTLKNL
jgi:hypothetical protein